MLAMVKVSPEEVVFSQASTQDQLTEVWRLNAQEWAAPITVEEHIERERQLSQLQASGDRWRTWVLTLKEKPEEVVASLETFQHAIIAHGDEGYREEIGCKIASVYTNPKYRRNGMAALLLKKIKEWFDGEVNAFVSVLYSDIGPYYYSNLGWKMASTQTLEIIIQEDAFDKQPTEDASSRLSKCKLLTDADLEKICPLDERKVKEEIKKTPTAGKTHWAFLPSAEYFSWHNKREDLNAKLMPNYSGQRARGAVAESSKTWIIWHYEVAQKKVKVQRIVSLLDDEESERKAEEAAGLLDFMLREVSSHGIFTVLIWNPPDFVQRAADAVIATYSGVVRQEIKDRKDSLPHARLKHGRSQDAEWLGNEFYAWC